MTVTESGLKYRILEQGTGKQMPKEGDFTASFRMTLEDGTVAGEFFHNGGVGDIPVKSFVPIVFSTSKILKGWAEGISFLAEGGLIEMEIPPELGYGEKGDGDVPPDSRLFLICRLFTANPVSFDKQAAKIFREEKFEKADSGVCFKILKPGNDKKPSFTNRVKIHYRVSRIDGVKYIDTFETGVPAEFAVVRMVAGMSEGVKMIGEGGSVDLILIPSVGFKRHSQTEGVPDNVLARVQIDLLEILPNKAIKLPQRTENPPSANPEKATASDSPPIDSPPKSEAEAPGK